MCFYLLLVVTVNPLRKPAAKKSKLPPPLPPPKPMSEEKIQKEEHNAYEEIDEYTVISQAVPEPEGGVLKYDYADMERGIRPMSYHQDEYGGSGGSVTGASGNGAFQSNDDSASDEEYIEPLTTPPKTVYQNSPPTQRRIPYVNMNTLNGKDLLHTKPPEIKTKTLPLRIPPHKEKSPACKPLSLPGNKNSLLGTGDNSELMNILSRRKQIERSSIADDDVFVKEEPPKITTKSKVVYQV